MAEKWIEEIVEWRLSNGVRVIVYSRSASDGDLEIRAFSPGGLAALPLSDQTAVLDANESIAAAGAGAFDAETLKDWSARHHVDVDLGLHDSSETLAGSAPNEELEALLQLIYARMAVPRRDEAAWRQWKERRLAAPGPATFEERAADAEARSEYPDNPRWKAPALDFDKSFAFYRDRFGDASDFTFVIVGSVELDRLRPLVERYLGGLPATGRTEVANDRGLHMPAGVVKKTWTLPRGKDEAGPPRARIALIFHGDDKWTPDGERDATILRAVLSGRLSASFKDWNESQTDVRASLDRPPAHERSFRMVALVDPAKADERLAVMQAVIDQLIKRPPDAAEVDGIKAYVRSLDVVHADNWWWADHLASAYEYGDDPMADVNNVAGLLKRVSSKTIRSAAKHYLDKKNYLQLIALPSE